MEEIKLPVVEIFYSVDGEGARTGSPAVFIRLFGCDLSCTYCDSTYACVKNNGVADCKDMTFDEILAAVEVFAPCKCITLTGGEPLIHHAAADLVLLLRRKGYWVNIETNGANDLREFINFQNKELPKQSAMDYFFTMDWKSISSGQAHKMLPHNLELLDTNDVLKFVVGNREDLLQMKATLVKYPEIDAQIYVSPVWGAIEPSEIVEFLLDNKLVYVKVQMQLHKLIWRPDMRGV